MSTPLLIGITGGIGSGKTTISEALRNQSYMVYNSDLEARKLMNQNPDLINEIKKHFGEDLYTNGELDRKKLATSVFSDKNLLHQLTTIVHPYVKEDFHRWAINHNSQKVLFLESAILFESGFNKLMNKIILVTANESERIERVMCRDGVSEHEVKRRMKNQLSEEEKAVLSDVVIYNHNHTKAEYLVSEIERQLIK